MITTWSEGTDAGECGIDIDGIMISYAELELAETRSEALAMGVTRDLCDEYEAGGGTYLAGSLREWLDSQLPEPSQARVGRSDEQRKQAAIRAQYDPPTTEREMADVLQAALTHTYGHEVRRYHDMVVGVVRLVVTIGRREFRIRID